MNPTEFSARVVSEWAALHLWLDEQGVPPGNDRLERLPLLERVQQLIEVIALEKSEK